MSVELPREVTRQGGLAFALKRLGDFVTATVLVLLTAPLMGLIVLLLALFQGVPVLFRQQRAGWYTRPFTLLKFRTMREAYDADGQPLPDEQRVTWIGEFLRRSSLDELPQLFNVLRGELSLIGNRPLPLTYVARMNPQQRRRFLTIPGMTGLDTVRGRYRNTWEQQFAVEVWYVDHWSAWLDLRTIAETVLVLATNRDQLPSGVFREEFLGSSVGETPATGPEEGSQAPPPPSGAGSD